MSKDYTFPKPPPCPTEGCGNCNKLARTASQFLLETLKALACPLQTKVEMLHDIAACLAYSEFRSMDQVEELLDQTYALSVARISVIADRELAKATAGLATVNAISKGTN
jgi:hypothetical protein